ncbi:MAG: AMP-binding protein [Caulobacterales bacterium]
MATEVLGVITDLAEEIHPHQKGRETPGLDGDLDSDFGLDSLGRVEAIHRLEAAFNTTLPEKLFAEASTVADLVRAIAGSGPISTARVATRVESRAAPVARAAPEQLGTIPDVLGWHAQHQQDRAHIYLSDGDSETSPITYRQLFTAAQRVAGGLASRGLEPGGRIGLMLPTGQAYFAAFLGVLLAGGVPAPIYPPWRMTRLEEHLRRQARILATAGVIGLITFEAARPLAHLLRDHVPSLAYVATTDEIEAAGGPAPCVAFKADDLALLQFTSGSTADPKGVMLSHANILANVRALSQAIGATPADVCVSWLPLYHDMGLIAAWLACLDQAAPFVVMSPLSFMARPERWLWTIHRNRATISAAPNFAFELCLSIPDERLAGLDLSSLRVVGCGSEPISPRTIADFTRKFAVYGFRAGALLPVYGLAECAAALTASPPGRAPRLDYVHRRLIATQGRAQSAPPEASDAQAFVSCGAPLIGHEVRIVGSGEREAPDRVEGRLQFRGPSATSGYFNAPDKTAELFSDGWLESGDLAYIADGEVFITGRSKDIVKRAGRNIHPGDIEAAVRALAGVARGGAVLFSAPDPVRGTERLVLAVETSLRDEPARRRLVEAAQELAADHLEASVDEIVLLAADSIPRTESGKVRRAALREAYLQGSAGGRIVSPGRQVLRLQVTAAAGRLRRAFRNTGERLYALYWWGVVGAMGLVLWPSVMLLPRLHWRWQAAHAVSRLAIRLLGHRLTVTREAPTPARDVVYVANHSSYLDSVVLSALLRGDLAFAVYKELLGDAFQGSFLRRLGVLFVERFEPTGAVADVGRALETVRDGRPLVVFPEATIMRMPGLLEFRMGAFVAAAQAGAPVVPVTIRGTRGILRHNHRWFPHGGAIHVHIGAPIPPDGADFEAALALKNAARADILAHVHEPDLAAETPIF